MLGSLKHKVQRCFFFYFWPIPPFITSLPYPGQENAFWQYPQNKKQKQKQNAWPNNQAKFSIKSLGSDHDK